MGVYENGITDQNVQYPNRFKINGVSQTIEPDFGVVTEPGTPVNRELITTLLAATGTTAGTASALTLAQPGFSLFDGATVRIKLHVDMAAGATLNVNGTEAIGIDLPSPAKTGRWITLSYSAAENKWCAVTTPSKPKTFLTEFTTSGTFVIADFGLSIGAEIDAYIVGGGGGGGSHDDSAGGGGGGGGGYCKLLKDYILTDSSYPIVVGGGGAASAGYDGNTGGLSSAFGTSANGGSGGRANYNGGDGGSGGGGGGRSENYAYFGGDGGAAGGNGSSGGSYGGRGGGNVDYCPINPYDGIMYGCGGGGGGYMDALIGAGGGGGVFSRGGGAGGSGYATTLSYPGGGGGAGRRGVGSAGAKGLVIIYA